MKVRSSIFLMLVVMVVPANGFLEMMQDFFAALDPMADVDAPEGPSTPSPTPTSGYYNNRRNPTYPMPTPAGSYPGSTYKLPSPITHGSQSPYYPVPTAGYPSYYQNTLQNPAGSPQSSGKSPFIYSPAAPQIAGAAYQMNEADGSKSPADYNSFLTNAGSPPAQSYNQPSQNNYPPGNYYPQSAYPQPYPSYPQGDQGNLQNPQSYPQYSQSYPQSGSPSQQRGQSTGTTSGMGGMSQQNMMNYLSGLYFGLQSPNLLSLMDHFYGRPGMGSGMESGLGSGLGGGMMNPGFGGMGRLRGGMPGPFDGPMGLTLGPMNAPLASSNGNSEMNPMEMAMTIHLLDAHDFI